MNNDQTELKPANDNVDKVMRPALIISDKTISNYKAYLNNFLVGLADQSIPVALVYDSKWEVESFIHPSIELVEYNHIPLPWFNAFSYKKIFQQLTDFKPTVLHCICESEIKLVQRLALEMDLPFIVTVNSLRRLKIPRRLLKNLLSVTVSAQSIGENIKRAKPRLADRVKVIKMAAFVDESNGCFYDLNKQICMVTAGKFNNESDFECLLEAIRYLAIDGYDFMLFIMGHGPAERKIRKRISNLGISEVVTMVPKMQNWRSVLSSADVFIRPFPEKIFNPLILEAMSTGTAVAACAGGVDDLIIDGRTAVVFDGDDEISIMNTLKELLNRPEDAHNLASRAQQHIREQHKVSDMVEAIIQTYRQASSLSMD
ncbi:MAG: glycosyltransferase family 4 protein [Planctomycetota bacterium]|jgi:glycosyltransferase involved in cell wall biosynthesis